MKNKIEDLRNHLFEVIESLKAKDKSMDIERAKTISDVARTIIETAKAETRHIEVVGGKGGSDFFPSDARKPGLPKLVGGKTINGAGPCNVEGDKP